MQITTIVWISPRNVFQVHGIDAAEKVVVRSNSGAAKCWRLQSSAPWTIKASTFNPLENALLRALQNQKVNISRHPPCRSLRAVRQILRPDRLSRQLRRLRDIGVIKRVAGSTLLSHPSRPAASPQPAPNPNTIIPALAMTKSLQER